jgi:hypothetical protein
MASLSRSVGYVRCARFGETRELTLFIACLLSGLLSSAITAAGAERIRRGSLAGTGSDE